MPHHPSLNMDQSKRTQLFDVAIREFVTNGFAQASLNRIIAEIRMSKSSFYHYFTNKTDLFQQIMEQSLEPFAQVLTEFDLDALTAKTFWPRIGRSIHDAADLFVKNPQIILLGRMFYKNYGSINEQDLTSDIMGSVQGFILRLMQRGQSLGVIRTDLPNSFLINAVMGLGMSIDQWILENFHAIPQDEFEKINELTMDMFVQLLTPRE